MILLGHIIPIKLQITVMRYGRRNWAVYVNGELLVVAVYKKGALAVQKAIAGKLRKHRDGSTDSLKETNLIPQSDTGCLSWRQNGAKLHSTKTSSVQPK
ncbi:MAG TPA: hypothetical protein VJU77_16900 [Chthoniobacterales bacterium]|nr:hypothetical protein [Chthoniobacterales bacterium]